MVYILVIAILRSPAHKLNPSGLDKLLFEFEVRIVSNKASCHATLPTRNAKYVVCVKKEMISMHRLLLEIFLPPPPH